MRSNAETPKEYIDSLPEDRKPVMSAIRKTINKNLPKGFKEAMSYGMLGWVVPHSLYSAGYHCDPKLPLPFINLASQKNHIAVYHMGLYGPLLEWLRSEWPKHSTRKLDMGKCCLRFKKIDDIPVGLIGDLCTKMNPHEWIELYEKAKPVQ
ncbi:MAG: DUF1801 domain-containing protein [Pyrinomonadaceae bacterium]